MVSASMIESPVARAPSFASVSEATAPADAKPALHSARQLFGFVPNLAVVMALEPATLKSYFQSLQAFSETSLTPIEQQLVLMAVSRVNTADYSLAIHAALAARLGAPPDVIKAFGTGRAVRDPKLSALRYFTEILTTRRGLVPESEVGALLAAGYSRAAVVAIAFGVAVKTFANSLANLAQTPVDAAFESALADLRP